MNAVSPAYAPPPPQGGPEIARRRGGMAEDPLARVMTLGDRAVRIGAAIGLGIALLTHTAASASAMASLYQMRKVVESARAQLHDYYWATYDVDAAPKKSEEKPPEPIPEPEPAPPPPPKAVVKVNDDPYEAVKEPPKPSEASKVITAPDKPDDPVDMTRFGVVSGEGNALGGQQSASGEGDKVVKNPAASLSGKVGGVGTAPVDKPAAPPPAGPDLSAPATLQGAMEWNCPFPAEADADQIDHAVASLMVTVRADGTPASVRVVSDPGHGFGRAARQCALSHRFMAAKDRSGQAIGGTTAPFNVRFHRD